MIEYNRQNSIRFTSPLFDRVTAEKPPADRPCADLEAFRETLDRNACFEPLRNDPEFKALYR